MTLRQDEEYQRASSVPNPVWNQLLIPCIRNGFPLLAFVFAFLFVMVTFDAEHSSANAQSNACVSLKRQLASLGAGGRKSSNSRYKKAIASQNRQIKLVRRKMDSRGCARTKRLFAREKHPSCRGLRATLVSMKNNVRSLQRKTGGKTSARSVRKQRRKITRAMTRNRCGETDVRLANTRKNTIVDQIFGNNARNKRRKQAEKDRRELRSLRNNSQQRTTEDRLKNYNTVRTVCVRRCDGYYFPVSFSTRKDGVAQDSDACSNLCPGTEMELFYHKTKGETAEDMISTITGEPYTTIPNAFAYRTSFDPNCSCNYRLLKREKPDVDTELNPKQVRQLETRALSKIALPTWRIDPDQDPETLANAGTDLEGADLDNVIQKKSVNELAQTRRVRVIGDEFLAKQ